VSAEKPREIATRILREHAAQKDYLENLVARTLAEAHLAGPDRGFVQEITFGVVRWQATLDWLIAQKTGGRTQKPALQILLRLGLYQMFWLDRIPDHAAVHETVEVARQLGFGPQSGFINAVLRGYLRERDATEQKLRELKIEQPDLGYSHPRWLCERWRQRWGEVRFRELLEWNNTPPPTFARLNTLRSTPEKLAAQWESEGVHFVPRSFDWTEPDLVFELKSHPPLAALPSFKQGLFYIQDPSTLLAVKELALCPGQSVLDLCAAPGGKATYAAQLIGNQGTILAQDSSGERLKLIAENALRLGATCIESSLAPLNEQPPPEARRFDRVLVDAPCSNTGVMRRRVDLRWRIREEEITRLRDAQLKLLGKAALHLKSGGTLVYSTCSLEPEENRELVDDFLRTRSDFKLENERELLPFVDGVDGAYVARLRSS
jgi:16S rRNA (cytosine967-C5)-methyltransferase